VKAKNNLAPHGIKALAYGFGARELGTGRKTGSAIWAPHIVWYPQHVEVTATEAMRAAGNQSGYANREAREFLLHRLEAGPVKADDLFEEGAERHLEENLDAHEEGAGHPFAQGTGQDRWHMDLGAAPKAQGPRRPMNERRMPERESWHPFVDNS
jgi:hypothetical protein